MKKYILLFLLGLPTVNFTAATKQEVLTDLQVWLKLLQQLTGLFGDFELPPTYKTVAQALQNAQTAAQKYASLSNPIITNKLATSQIPFPPTDKTVIAIKTKPYLDLFTTYQTQKIFEEASKALNILTGIKDKLTLEQPQTVQNILNTIQTTNTKNLKAFSTLFANLNYIVLSKSTFANTNKIDTSKPAFQWPPPNQPSRPTAWTILNLNFPTLMNNYPDYKTVLGSKLRPVDAPNTCEYPYKGTISKAYDSRISEGRIAKERLCRAKLYITSIITAYFAKQSIKDATDDQSNVVPLLNAFKATIEVNLSNRIELVKKKFGIK